MRKFLFYTLAAVLAALLLARALQPPAAEYAMAVADGAGYNLLDVALPVAKQTAGSAQIAEMNAYYLCRRPTEKNALTGILRGKNLVLICADAWTPDPTDRGEEALHRLWQEGAKFTQVYRPDWYQGTDGREFALLSGLMPTQVKDGTALAWIGAQDVYLPFAPARLFTAAGYRTTAYLSDPEHEAAYVAMGFERTTVSADGGRLDAAAAVHSCAGMGRPFFAFFLWDAPDCGASLDELMDTLETEKLLDDTAICVLTGNTEEYAAQLFLWSRDFPAPETDVPCSELDIAPTLENLFGLPYDARFLSGRDIFAAVPDEPCAATPLVTLHGSAYSDWITDRGSYIAAAKLFTPAPGAAADEAYTEAVCRLQYDRYVFARRILENNYFELIFGEQ